MSAAQFNCPHCTGIFEVDSSMGGQQIACPMCQGVMTLPDMETPSTPSGHHSWQPEQPASSDATPSYPAASGNISQLACPLCNGPFQVTPEMAGQQVSCPHCAGLVMIPGSHTPMQQMPDEPQPHTTQATESPAARAPEEMPAPAPTAVPSDSVERPMQSLYPPGMGPSESKPAAPTKKPSHEQATSQFDASKYPPGYVPPGAKSQPAVEPTAPAKPQERKIDSLLPPGVETPLQPPSPATPDPNTGGKSTSPNTDPASAPARARWQEPSPQQPTPQQPTPQQPTPQQPTPQQQTPAESNWQRPESSPAQSSPVPTAPQGASRPSPVDSLLPPGISHSDVNADGVSVAETESWEVESLLPAATSGAAGLTPGQEVSVPYESQPQSTPQTPFTRPLTDSPVAKTILLPTEDGGQVALRDPVKTIRDGDEEIELRTLTPEEKARRRFWKNLFVWTFGLVMLAITLYVMFAMGPLDVGTK